MAEDVARGVHKHLVERAPRILRYDPQDYFPEWQGAVRRSFRQLLGLMPGKVKLVGGVLAERDGGTYGELRFGFPVEPAGEVEVVMRLPRVEGAVGMVVQIGGEEFWGPLEDGFGVLRLAVRGDDHEALKALLVGRTMMGERVWDVVRVIDMLEAWFSERVDATKIVVMGGVEAFYAGAFEPRVAGVMCEGVGFFSDEVETVGAAGVIPNVLHYFERSELAGLIVPRGLVVGEANNGAECFAEMKAIFAGQGVGEKCVAVSGGRAEQWRAMRRVLNW